jgi:hypothetical protein
LCRLRRQALAVLVALLLQAVQFKQQQEQQRL